MKFTIYILENPKGQFYTGHTSQEIQKRVIEHNHGACQWTRNKGPWKVRYTEQRFSKEDAYRRERQIKRYKGGRAFKELINAEGSHSPVECARLESG